MRNETRYARKNEEEIQAMDTIAAQNLQHSEDYSSEFQLMQGLERRFGWNSLYAEEIAELAWAELYAEKEGE